MASVTTLLAGARYICLDVRNCRSGNQCASLAHGMSYWRVKRRVLKLGLRFPLELDT